MINNEIAGPQRKRLAKLYSCPELPSGHGSPIWPPLLCTSLSRCLFRWHKLLKHHTRIMNENFRVIHCPGHTNLTQESHVQGFVILILQDVFVFLRRSTRWKRLVLRLMLYVLRCLVFSIGEASLTTRRCGVYDLVIDFPGFKNGLCFRILENKVHPAQNTAWYVYPSSELRESPRHTRTVL